MIAKKYAKALFETLTPEEWEKVRDILLGVAQISRDSKFLLTMNSPLLSTEEKVRFFQQWTGNFEPKFANFVKILLINKRIELLKPIALWFNKLVAEATNRFEGIVTGNIEPELIPQLEQKLGEQFNAQIKLTLNRQPVGGIRLFVEVLNVEVELSEQRLKENLIQSILKAI